MRQDVEEAVRSIAVALGWVTLSLTSLTVGVVALLTTFALSRSAAAGADVWMFLFAIVLTFGVPFALAAWKHHGDARRIRASMAWLPMVWNGGGLLVGALLIPDLMGHTLRHAEWVVEGRLGEDAWGTRLMSALGEEAADVIDPGGEVRPRPTPVSSNVALDRAITIPFNEEGNAIFVDLELHGPGGNRATKRYLFDTGASFTTITTEVAAELGIDVPNDAPTVEFNTASGLRESRVVHLDGVTIGDVHVPSLLVSVCNSCATGRTEGLLGLNVMREFVVQMDYQQREIQLLPRIPEDGRIDRAYDIRPVVVMHIRGRPDILLGRVRWIVEVENRGTVPIQDFMPQVDFTDGPTLYGESIPTIAPGATESSLVEGKVADGTEEGNKLEFTLSVAEASW